MMSALCADRVGLCSTGVCHSSQACACGGSGFPRHGRFHGENCEQQITEPGLGEMSPPCSRSRRNPRKGRAGGVRTHGPTENPTAWAHGSRAVSGDAGSRGGADSVSRAPSGRRPQRCSERTGWKAATPGGAGTCHARSCHLLVHQVPPPRTALWQVPEGLARQRRFAHSLFPSLEKQ